MNIYRQYRYFPKIWAVVALLQVVYMDALCYNLQKSPFEYPARIRMSSIEVFFLRLRPRTRANFCTSDQLTNINMNEFILWKCWRYLERWWIRFMLGNQFNWKLFWMSCNSYVFVHVKLDETTVFFFSEKWLVYLCKPKK